MGVSKPVVPLTDEQRKLAEENEHLIWDFIRWHHLGMNKQELVNDWYCVLAEDYLAAVRKYQGLGKFKTFALKCMHIGMQRRGVYNNRQMRSGKCVSINQPICSGGKKSLIIEGVLFDARPSTEDCVVAQIAAKELWDQIQSVLPAKHAQAFQLRLFYGKDIQSAALHIGMDRDKLKHRQMYARRLIRKKLYGDTDHLERLA